MTEMSKPQPPLDLTGGRVAVTGAGGFIGSHLVEALLRRGVQVRALVHYNALGGIGNLEALEPDLLAELEIVAGDVQDAFAVREFVSGCHVVFHLAALIGIPYSYVAPASYVSVNIGGTLNVLEAGRVEQVTRIIVTSTSETYGTAQYTPIDERHPLVAQSPYSATKIGADQLALSYYRAFELPVTVVRPFNTFGPRQSERAIIPTIVSQAIANAGPIRLGSLDPRRDLTYVTDTVEGFLTLAGRGEALGSVTNLGTGESRTVAEMLSCVGRVLGRQLSVATEPQRIRPGASEVMELRADASRARTLGWRPAVSFEDGVARVVEYWRARARSTAQGRYRI